MARRRRDRRPAGDCGKALEELDDTPAAAAGTVLQQADFMYMLPTPASIQAQTDTRLLQGRTGLWFAGGYLFPYDAQETALLSAIEVANGLNGGSTPRGDALLASV